MRKDNIEWRKVDKWPAYSISSDGRVWSDWYNKELVPKPDRYGYLTVNLCDGNGLIKTVKIHRLVAEAFIPNDDNKPQVNHINCDKHDNRVENIEWCTNAENIRHGWENGIITTHKPRKGISACQKVMVNETGEVFESQKECAMAKGIHQGSISNCLRGKRNNAGGYTFRYTE